MGERAASRAGREGVTPRTTIRALWLTWRMAWQEALSNRRGFWTQAGVMVVNDIVWIVFWALFFRRVGTLRGWDLQQMMVLYAVLGTSGGIVLGFLNNARRLAMLAADGGLDAALSAPVPTLPLLLVRRIEPVFVGDVLFGIALFVFFCNPTPTRTAAYVFGVVCAALVIGGFLVITGSSGFFAGRNEAGELGFHALFLFSSYPVDIFSGLLKLFLYGVVPAGFVTAAPVRLVTDFDVRWALALAAVAIVVPVVGTTMFRSGLARYTSGSVWTGA